MMNSKKVTEKNMDNYILLLSLAIVQGFTSSLHCVGMCGPILASIQQDGRKWIDNIIYQGGRLLGYTILGMLLGISGRGVDFLGELSSIRWFSGILASLALIYTGGKLLFPGIPGFQTGRLNSKFRPVYGKLRSLPSPSLAPLGFGMLSAILPCGVLLPAYTLAFSSGSLSGGGFVMVGFFLGTLPALYLAGASITYFKKFIHPNKLSYIGIFLVMIGLGTILYRVNLKSEAGCHTPGHTFLR